MHPKLLSHRARGFGAPEHTAEALRRATHSSVAFIELDTRASADGALFVHHDPVTRSPRLRFAQSDAHTLATATHDNGEPILRLEDALRMFAARTHRTQRLCLDIKDHGFEDEHLRLVRRAGLESHVHFISWIPQTLVRLHQLGTTAPLHLSHASLLQFPALAWLSRPWRRSVRRIGRFVLMGHHRHEDPLDDLRHGFQHALVSDTLPTSLLGILARSGGGICVHYALAGHRLGAFCREHGLELWVFTARSRAHYERLAGRSDVSVVFADAAGSIACNEHPAPGPKESGVRPNRSAS
ncbi:MAG TPA: glycerophosphodiester phosphodiesterase [Longimicrobiales bacterium]|nr:glycerophosphodiester phosphodiesterase [Longimicrobiales bacterium]